MWFWVFFWAICGGWRSDGGGAVVDSESEWWLLLDGEAEPQGVYLVLHPGFAYPAHVCRLLAYAFGLGHFQFPLKPLDGLHLGLAGVAVGDVYHQHHHHSEYREPVAAEEVGREQPPVEGAEHQ